MDTLFQGFVLLCTCDRNGGRTIKVFEVFTTVSPPQLRLINHITMKIFEVFTTSIAIAVVSVHLSVFFHNIKDCNAIATAATVTAI